MGVSRAGGASINGWNYLMDLMSPFLDINGENIGGIYWFCVVFYRFPVGSVPFVSSLDALKHFQELIDYVEPKHLLPKGPTQHNISRPNIRIEGVWSKLSPIHTEWK